MKKILIPLLLLTSCGINNADIPSVDPAKAFDKIMEYSTKTDSLPQIIGDSVTHYVKDKAINKLVDTNKTNKLINSVNSIIDELDTAKALEQRIENQLIKILQNDGQRKHNRNG